MFLAFILVAGPALTPSHAQDGSLPDLLNDSASLIPSGRVSATFKATQIVNGATVESPAAGDLQFMIMHRFGRLNEGAYALFGLDNATIRFAFDYGLTDRLALGIGRSSLEKVWDASFKYKILRQTWGKMPVSVSAFGLMAHTTQRYSDKPYLNAKLRTMYSSQLLVARKFSPALSLQLTPTWLHFNLVEAPADKNDIFALGVGGRVKVSRRVSLNGEYHYLFPGGIVSRAAPNAVSAGVDIETGGHVFQLVFTNAQGMIPPYFIARNTGTWQRGDIYFGFNVTRNFTTGRKRKAKRG